MRGGFPDLSCPAGGGPCRAICFREDWLASPVPAPPRNAENPGMGSGGELFFQDRKRIKVFFEAQGLDTISVRGGRSLRFAPWQSGREISSCCFRWTDSGCCVLDVFLSSGGARPARKPAAQKESALECVLSRILCRKTVFRVSPAMMANASVSV